jgi:hypothetical protein
MALGAVMVAGSAAPASAASQVDFSGFYRVMFNSETNIGYAADGQPGDFTDSYFQDRLQINLNFHPTDEITVYWRFRGPSSYGRWGFGGTGGRDAMTTKFVYGEIKQDWGTVLVGRMSDELDVAGMAALGYQPSTLPVFTNVGPFDRAEVMDGIRYSYDFDNGFSILGQYVKLGNSQEDQGGGGVTNPVINNTGVLNGLNDSDSDYDRFQLLGSYLWDGGGASLHLLYDRNSQIRGRGGEGGGTWGSNVANLNVHKTDYFLVNPAIVHSWGDFSVHFEAAAAWGKEEYNGNQRVGLGYVNQPSLTTGGLTLPQRQGTSTSSSDGDGWGAYLDFDYNYGPGNATLAGWYVSGNDLGDTDNKALADLVGGNFYPLLVAYNGSLTTQPAGNRANGNSNYGVHANAGVVGFANNAFVNYVAPSYLLANTNSVGAGTGFINVTNAATAGGATASNWLRGNTVNNIDRTRTTVFANGNTNHWAIALTGNHAFTDDISLHYGLAYLGLVNSNYSVASSGTYNDATGAYAITGYQDQDKDLGFEIDLGLSFQLLDNLKLASGFGYMFNGDALKNLKGYNLSGPDGAANRTINASWEDPEDSYVWFNSLTFSF